MQKCNEKIKNLGRLFFRRIHKVVIYSKDGSIKEYDSVRAYLDRDEFVEIDDDVKVPFD